MGDRRGNYLLVFYEAPGTSTGQFQQINLVVLSTAGFGSIVSTSVFYASTSIASQPWVYAGSVYMLTVYTSALQQTYFVLEQPVSLDPSFGTTSVAAKYLSSNDAGSPPSNGRCPNAVQLLAGNVGLPVLERSAGLSTVTGSASGAATTTYVEALLGLQLNLTITQQVRSSQLGENLHLASGGMLWDYDGQALVEHGFNVFPEVPTLAFQTTQLAVVTDGYDSTCTGSATSQFTGRICIPDNGAQPGGPVGQLITPGEYIIFNAGSRVTHGGDSAPTPHVVYFQVNGNGSAPAGSTFAGIATTACALTSQMSAIEVATALAATLQGISDITGAYTVTYTATPQGQAWTTQSIGLVSVAGSGTPRGISPPSLNRVCTATQTFSGTGGTVSSQVTVSCIPAALISSGQYVTLTVPIASGTFGTSTTVTVYFWFSNPTSTTYTGASNQALTAVDPNPFGIPSINTATIGGWNVHASYIVGIPYSFGNFIGIEIPLTGNETEGAIATYLVNALFTVGTYYGLHISTPMAVGSTLVVQSNVNQVIASPQYPSNPLNVGMGQGYIGQVVDGVAGPVAINYVSVYEWVDSQNQLHQSAPSGVATAYFPTYTAVGGGQVLANTPVPVSQVISVSTTPLLLTQKSSLWGRTDVDIAVYRTISGATVGSQVYYRITPGANLLFNTPAQTAPISYSDYSSDIGGSGLIGINSGETLYTTGGVLENDAPPACTTIINHQNRLWLAGLEDPNLLWYSEAFQQGYGVAFSNLQTIRMNPVVGNVNGGDVTAMASMDGYLIIFQQNQAWYLQGDGPDSTGAGQFSNPQLVASSSAIGCRDPGSVVLTPNGVIFKSNQGFYLLSRNLQLNFIGAPVKAFNSDIVSSAVALTNSTQVIFLSANGTTLMFDWFYNAWSTFTGNHQGLDSIRNGTGVYCYVNTSNGVVCEQTPNSFVDANGEGYPMVATTAWLKVSAIQGFGRIKKALFQGLFLGTQPYQVQTAYNYNAAIVDTFVYQPLAGQSVPTTWGSSSLWGNYTWGDDSALVSYSNSIQFRDFPSQQLCEAVQFTFMDLPPYSSGATPALNALDLEVAVRRGGFKRGPGAGPANSIG